MTTTAANRRNAGAAGCIEATVKAINTHIDNANICKEGCKALKNIIFDNCSMLLTTVNTEQQNR